MKKLRTRYFRVTLIGTIAFSALFLGWIALFGKQLAVTHFSGITGAVFSVMYLATASFLAVCFVPFFFGDKRWYSIPALLTAVFVAGAAMLWQVPAVV